MRVLPTLSLVTCALLLSACAGMGSFKDFDANRNGGITREEADRKRALADIFDGADDNGDGHLDEEEFDLAKTAIELGRGDQKRRKMNTERGGPVR